MVKLSLFIFSLIAFLLASNNVSIQSPDKILTVHFILHQGKPYYQILRFSEVIIDSSRLGFELTGPSDFSKDFILVKQEMSTHNETWTQVWGEQSKIENHYNELKIYLQKKTDSKQKMEIIFRLFDDGLGLRYVIPQQKSLHYFEISDELTEFNFRQNYSCWWIKAYQPNRYEYLYQNTPLNQVDTAHTPFTMQNKDGLTISIHEANLTDFASMTLANKGRFTLEADLVPWYDGIKVKTQTPMVSPWRTIQIVDRPADLITSYLILNLNEPNRLKDTSWIKPGKYVGIWWEMHIGKSTWGSGPRHGATTANAKKYIDFAAKYGFDGVLIEGWNMGWDGNWIKNGDRFNFTKPYPDFDLQWVAQYAKKKGVQIIGHHETAGHILNYERQIKKAFAYYQKLGIHIVKTGYVAHGRHIKWVDDAGQVHYETHHGQFMVRHYRKVVQWAAQYQVMLDVHEPIKDTGIRRTWPNMMTREGARGQEYNAWSADGGNPPEHTTILPFTRLLAGPMDFTPGIFDLLLKKWRPKNRINTTLAKQLALYVVIYSPLQMAADLPENYEQHLDAFKFIQDVPVDWDETRVLHARIGDYITVVRKDRHSNDWYLGSITDEHGRTLQTPLSFLDKHKTYRAEIYCDGLNANWETNPLSYKIEQKIVNTNTVLTLRLAPGGGTAIRFTPVEIETH